MRPLLPLLAAVLLTGSACRSTATVMPEPVGVRAGTWALASVSGRGLPAPPPCGGMLLLGGHLTLNENATAEHVLRYRRTDTGATVDYAAVGTWASSFDRGVVELTATARWSHRPGETEELVLRFEPTGRGLERTVGLECDAMEAEVYRAP